MRQIFLIAANLVKEMFRKKDAYVLIVFLLILLAYLANAAFFGVSHIYRYLKDIGLGIVFLFSLLISVPFCAKLMIAEINDKTIYPLLAKPVSRSTLVLGKFFGALLASWGSFTVFYVMFSAVSVLKEGSFAAMLYFQVYIAGLFMFLLLNSLVMLLSITCTFSTTVTLSYLIFFLMSWFGSALNQSAGRLGIPGEIIYYLLPHFEFFDLRRRLVHSWEALPLWIMATICIYSLAYSAVLILTGIGIFKKKYL